MENNDFSKLTELWQEATPSKQSAPQLAQLQKKQQRQRWFMLMNAGFELVVLLFVSYFWISESAAGAALPELLWLGFVTLWGWVLFVVISFSRWRSLQAIKSGALSHSIALHTKLLQQSMFRWRLSVAATALFTVVFVVFTLYQCGSGSCSATYWVRYTVAFAVLLLALLYFEWRARGDRRACQELME